jgi:hypothetical protein
MRRGTAVLLVIAALVLAGGSAFGQCSMCRTALEQSEEGRAIAGSFRYGILLLLAAPYLIFGTVGFVVFRAYRRKRAAAAELAAEPLLYGIPKTEIRRLKPGS